MESRTGGRSLEIATALALGLVSLVTALGVLQASIWNDTAARFVSDSTDARDQGIALEVTSQLKQRSDLAGLLEGRMIAREQDEALAAGDIDRAVDLEGELLAAIGNAYDLPEGAFDAWRQAGFPDDARPTDSAQYLVETRGPADALRLTSQRLGDVAKQYAARAAIFGQAALVHALALFLFGVAGINRLRLARYVTLSVGALVFLFGLVLMATAY